MEKLEITKENYIGYSELYKSNNILTRKEFTKYFVSTLLFLGIIYGVEIGLLSSYLSLPLNCFLICASTIVGTTIMSKYIANKNFKKVKERYPYIEKYDNYTLKSALEEAKIICDKKVNGISIQEFDVKKYEDGLKMNSIKEELYNDSEYNSSSLNDFNSINEEVKEKTKVKIKQYVNRG